VSVAAGTRLGPYEVTGTLGAGGMGEVYRAVDSRLKREVAIKVLPEAFAADRDRVARFEREAQVLAQLHHPNIASIFGLEQANGTLALVMELVEGEDLAARLARGPLPLDEALPIARQIADALEAAHEHGIVHRDLKPANVKLRADGTVKVLDFGLAKAADPTSVTGGDVRNSPTISARATQLGMILGTAAYMAPEQAKGRIVDARADVWAFGAVLFEMLTGQRAFPGDDVSEVFAAVIKSEPDWSALPADTPTPLRRLLRRCLEKDPRGRLHAIGDARLELEEREEAPPLSPAAAEPSVRRWPGLVVAAALAGALVAGLAAMLLWHRAQPPGGEIQRLSILAPPGLELFPDTGMVAISPDGRSVAFGVGNIYDQDTQLWVRSAGSLAARRFEGTDGAQLPFWSPDSSRVGFWSDGKLRAVSLASGRVDVLCDSNDTRGASWGAKGVIVFAPGANSPLFRVSDHGGDPVAVTRLDAAHHEADHRFPSFLPDGEHFLYAALPGHGGKFEVYVGSLSGGPRARIGAFETAPVYAEPGWLLFTREGTLTAQRFDARTLKLSGEVVALDDHPDVILDPAISYTAETATSVSRTGALAYYSSGSNRTRAVWLGTDGKGAGDIALPPGNYTDVAVSPQGMRAIIVRQPTSSESDLLLLDLERGGATVLTTGAGLKEHPVWSPDGTRFLFDSDRDGITDIFVKDVGDSRPEQPFYRSSVDFKGINSWSSDGRWIALTQLDPLTLQNVYLLPGNGGKPVSYVQRPLRDRGMAFSPDARLLAYISEDLGTLRLYIDSVPQPGHAVRVSDRSVTRVWWAPDQRQIFFVDARNSVLSVADLALGDPPSVGVPRVLATLPPGLIALDAMPDRKRFLALVPESTGAGSITVVQNWLAGVGK